MSSEGFEKEKAFMQTQGSKGHVLETNDKVCRNDVGGGSPPIKEIVGPSDLRQKMSPMGEIRDCSAGTYLGQRSLVPDL